MATLFLVPAFGFLILNFSPEKHVFAQPNENWDDGPNWNLAIKKIKELENLVKIQDERISVLEKRPTLSEFRSTVELQETVQRQNDRIVKLETRISELEVMVTDPKAEAIHIEQSEEVPDFGQNIFTPKKNFIRKGIFIRKLRL
ncbi:uncharacterized protein LOC111104204 [Crassostrea virginica]